MRNLTLLAVGISTLALSGCSYLSGLNPFGGNNHGTYSNNGYQGQGGSYGASNACSAGNNYCSNGPVLSKWNVEGGIGRDLIRSGTTISPVNNGGGNVINRIKSEDAYGNGTRAELGGSYALSTNRKLTGTVNYFSADGKAVDLGVIGGNAVTGRLSQYEGYGLEAGIRQYFRPRVAAQRFDYRPYVEGRVGANRLDDISLTYANTADGTGLTTTDFFEGGWVPTVSGLVGIETPITNNSTIGFETGVRYTGSLDDSNIAAGNPLATANRTSDTWSVPLTIRGRYRF